MGGENDTEHLMSTNSQNLRTTDTQMAIFQTILNHQNLFSSEKHFSVRTTFLQNISFHSPFTNFIVREAA